MRILAFLFLLMMPAFALEADEVLADPVLEAQARAISAEVRCVSCAAQSVEDSPAPLARDVRYFIRTELTNGSDAAAIKNKLRDRYGDKILMQPPLKVGTGLLWCGPAVLLLLALFMGRKFVRRG